MYVVRVFNVLYCLFVIYVVLSSESVNTLCVVFVLHMFSLGGNKKLKKNPLSDPKMTFVQT